tara:strand:- start:5775 stop:6809 length:1035 start_codon:yes stop_codon:yes gene_type:complete
MVNGSATGLTFVDEVVDTSTFVTLNDTPSNYTSQENNFVQVNSGATGLAFTSVFIVSTFLNLDDTPSNYTGKEKFITRVNSSANGLEFIAPTFLEDIDTPSSYVGQSNYVVVVNAGATGLTFTKKDETFISLLDTPSTYVGQSKKILEVNAGETGLSFVNQVTPIADTSTFVTLNDTPSSYTGQSNKVVVVNAGETGLAFVTESVGSKIQTTKLSLTAQSVQKLYTTGQGANPQTLVAGVTGKIVVPLSITYIATYSSGFQEASTADLFCGFDAVNSQSAGARWTSVKNMMNGKAVGTYTYTPMGLNVNTDFSSSGKAFMLWSDIAFNGQWIMDVYFSYALTDA